MVRRERMLVQSAKVGPKTGRLPQVRQATRPCRQISMLPPTTTADAMASGVVVGVGLAALWLLLVWLF